MKIKEGDFVSYNGRASIVKNIISTPDGVLLGYLNEVYQDYVRVDKLKRITTKTYEKYIDQRTIQHLSWGLKEAQTELELYKRAFRQLQKTKKLSKPRCSYSTNCLKGGLGLCDGECDYPGA